MIKGSISGRERCLRKRGNRVENFSLQDNKIVSIVKMGVVTSIFLYIRVYE